MSTTKKLTVTAVCIALCYVLPIAFHAMALGTALSPMHLPVLLCGVLCGWPYGLACGVLGPILSSLVGGMPPAPMLLSMIPELAVYGVLSGLLMALVHTGRTAADLYLSLVPAMVLGRVAGGIAQALVYLSSAREYSIALWATGYFVNTAPGAVLHLIAVPALYILLSQARLVPARYPKAAV